MKSQKVDIPEGTDFNEGNLKKEDFYGYAPENKFIHKPSRALWPAKSVNERLPRVRTGNYTKKGNEKSIKPSSWIAQNQSVETMIWKPGAPTIMKNKIVTNGGLISHKGLNTFNLYQPPRIDAGNATNVTKWINHIKRIYPDNSDHIIKWLAHRVQRPGEKINHGIILGGPQGIGKDTILAPVKLAIGPWNFKEVSPTQLLGRFNGFVKSVILRVSEARDMGDKDRYKFYEHLKQYTASPPEMIRCDEKNRQEYPVVNVTGVVITTNHKQGGIYLPKDDRRHYVAWSETMKTDFGESYFKDIWDFYKEGGINHVAAYLQQFDLSNFNPKAPPPKTQAFLEFVDAGRSPEDVDMAAALQKIDQPDAVTVDQIKTVAGLDFKNWLKDRSNRTKIPHVFENAGYLKIINDAAQDDRWPVKGTRKTVYGNRELSRNKRIKAVQNL